MDPPSPESGGNNGTSTTSPLTPAFLVTGEPVLATAVPLDHLTDSHNDIESNNDAAGTSSSAKKDGGGNGNGPSGVGSAGDINNGIGGGSSLGAGFHEGVSVGPAEGATGLGAIGIPMAHAVQIEAGMDGRSGTAAAAGGGVGGPAGSGGGGGVFPPQRIDDLALPEVRKRIVGSVA